MTPIKVLIIDDESDFAEALCTYLHDEFSSEVATCLSGEEGLQLFQAKRFDVVIVDQIMPGMSGVKVIEQLARIAPECYPILCTGYPPPSRALRFSRDHRYILLPKPIDRVSLRQAVLAALRDAAEHVI